MSISKIAAIATLLSLFSSVYSAPSQACGQPQRSPIDWRPKANDTKIFQIGRDPDNPREIRVSVPSLYNGSAINLPLILAFHDKEQSPAEFEYATRLSDRDINENKILVYPKAVNDTWQSEITVRRWQKNRKNAERGITDDIGFTRTLLEDLDTVICFDRSRVYATGLGTGGGMVHLLACDPEISHKIAAYAIVSGGFGTKAVAPQWAECVPSRLPAPMLEIHGEDDKVLPYLLNDWEPAKSRMAVPHWLEDWSERNGCGEPIGDPIAAVDGTGTSVSVTKLEGGGWTSEAEAYDGAVLRIAKSCPILGSESAEDTEDKKVEDTEEQKGDKEVKEGEEVRVGKDEKEEAPKEEIMKTDPASFTILHYRVKDFGHGWPLQQVKSGKDSKKSKMFDATELVVDWFKIHKLPEPEPVPAAEAKEGEDAEEVDEAEEEVEEVEEDATLEELKESPKQPRVKQTLEEDHDEL